jgi:hypothetical protein
MAGLLSQIASFLLLSVLSVMAISIVYMSWKNGISPMPSSAPVRRAVADEINRLTHRNMIVEAGSGWGTLAMCVIRYCPVNRLIGLENSVFPLWCSRIAARLTYRFIPKQYAASPACVSFIRADIYTYPYEKADVVVCYLFPGAMKRLSVVFRKRLAPGSRIISVCFALPGWRPEREVVCGDLYRTKVYVYNTEENNGAQQAHNDRLAAKGMNTNE